MSDFIPPETVLGTTTSWLPVTTAYPSVSGCAEAFFLFPGQPAPVGWDPGYGYFASGTLRCLPPEATRWHEQGHQDLDAYTSLSIRPIVCPAAFTTAVTEIRSGSSTRVMCCPSGYDVVGGQPGRVAGECRSSLSVGQVISYTASLSSSWTSTTWEVATATGIDAIAMIGWNVAPSTSSTSATSSTNTSPISTSGPQTSSDLSKGAAAGIGAGVGFGVFGLFSLLALYLLRRRRKHARFHAVPKQPNAAEASSVLVHELHSQQTRIELGSK